MNPASLENWMGGPLAGGGGVHRLRAKASLAVGRHDDALDAVRRARRRGPGSEPFLLALEEADALFGLQRYAEALAVATRALKRRPPDADLEARLRVVRGHALWLTGRVVAGGEEVSRAGAIAAAGLTRARAHETLGLFAWKEQDLERAREHLAEARRRYAGCGSREGLVRTLEKEGAVLRDAGLLAQALRIQTDRVEIASTTTRLDALARARNDRGSLLTVMGRWAEARRELDLAADLFHRVSDPREFTLAGVNRAALDLAAGDLRAARAALDRAREIDGAAPSNPRSLAEILLFLSDVHLAAGDAQAAERTAGEALGLFAVVRDRVGECRGRFRRSHALLALGRGRDAVREARRSLEIPWPSRIDLRGLGELALGRALLRTRRREAGEAFERALAVSDERPGIAHAARLGRALARGAGRDDPEVGPALSALEAWGDRRLLAYCVADVREVLGEAPAASPAVRAEGPPVVLRSCDSAQAVADAAVALARDGEWPERWAEAMRALGTVLPWWRAVFVGEPGLELRRDLGLPVALCERDVSRVVAAGCSEATVRDLTGDPSIRDHPARVLHALRAAVVAPAGPGATLYLDVREGEAVPGPREAAVVGHVARLLSHHAPTPVRDDPAPAGRFPDIVGRCAAMEGLFRHMETLAASEVSVHVFGETGTGKEKVARALHRQSARGRDPFVPINASTLSDELFESEMFGHSRGAFTGAVASRHGHVAEAEGGTLFIDEVTDLTPRAQAKLLRLLQEKEYRRLGETETRRADVRIITASNAALEQRVAAGLFREDLMYRLNVVVLTLPPLRERGDDRLRLARHFLRVAAERERKPIPALPAEVARLLSRYAWPGNVRELENEMSRLVVLGGGGPLRAEDVSPRLREDAPAPAASTLRGAQAAFERDHITRALAQHAGNRARTACFLGITRQALVQKIKRLGL